VLRSFVRSSVLLVAFAWVICEKKLRLGKLDSLLPFFPSLLLFVCQFSVCDARTPELSFHSHFSRFRI
jgi:hypothetical protein